MLKMENSNESKKGQNICTTKRHEWAASELDQNDRTLRNAFSLKNQEGNVWLNKDMFWLIFDFMRPEALMVCQFLSKDVRECVLQRIAANDHVLQVRGPSTRFSHSGGEIQDSGDFPDLMDFISRVVIDYGNNLRITGDDCSSACNSTIEKLSSMFINDMSQELSYHPKKIDKKSSPNDIHIYLHAEGVFEIALDDGILKRMTFRPGVYNACRFFSKIYQVVASSCGGAWFIHMFQASRKTNHCVSYFQTEFFDDDFWNLYYGYIEDNIVPFYENLKSGDGNFKSMRMFTLDPHITNPAIGNTYNMFKSLTATRANLAEKWGFVLSTSQWKNITSLRITNDTTLPYGLQTEDIILEINGIKVGSPELMNVIQLQSLMTSVLELRMLVIRNGVPNSFLFD